MITVEGLGGKGALWTVFQLPAGMPITGTNLQIAAADSINPIQPFECYMPPSGPMTVYHVPGMSPYGGRVSKVQVGTLNGVTNSPDTENPCEHSTMTGSLSLTSADPLKAPHFRLPVVWNPGPYVFLGPDGSPVTYLQGRIANQSNAWAYDRYGVLTAFYPDTINQEYWYNGFVLTTDVTGPVSSPNPIYSHGIKNGMIISDHPIATVASRYTIVRKHSCKHVSANKWIFDEHDEYHGPDPYVPASLMSPLGYGKTITAIHRIRTVSMVGIQTFSKCIFRCLLEISEEVSYMGWDVSARIPINGKCAKTSTVAVLLPVLAPGLSVGATFPEESVNAYCAAAIPRAKMLYRCSDATIARSNAVADVSGLDSNWIENLAQIGGTADVVLPLLLGWKALKRGNLSEAKRAIAGAYLSYKYVIAPGISDYNDVSKNMGTIFKGFTTGRFSNERRRGRLIVSTPVCDTLAKLTYTCVYSLQLKDNPFATIFNALERLGLDPSAGNIWDLIPFSFVVDWFFHIGSALDKADAMYNNTLIRNVKTRVESFKVQWPLSTSDMKVCSLGDYSSSVTEPLSYSWYDRRILAGVGSIDPFAGQKHDGLSVSQTTQGMALLSSFRR